MRKRHLFMGVNFGTSYYWTILIYYNINNFIIRQFSRRKLCLTFLDKIRNVFIVCLINQIKP
jgi:hypothetical protein